MPTSGLPTEARQPFCSILACIGRRSDEVAFERALRYLPRRRSVCQEYELSGLHLAVVLPNVDPLHQQVMLRAGDYLLFLQGDFYRAIDRAPIVTSFAGQRFDAERFAEALRGLVGSFNGFVVNLADGSCVAFVDQFGHNYLYHASDESGVWLSTSIWPLLRRGGCAPRIDSEAVQDTLIFGYPNGDATPVCGVQIVQPGRMVHIDSRGSLAEEYVKLPARRSLGLSESLDRFAHAFAQHFDYVSRHVADDRFVATITGGRDTRVVLNAILSQGIVPTCLTGTGYPSKVTRDANRGAAAARLASCPVHVVDYTEASPELLADSFFLSEGAGTASWMARLSEEGRRYGDVMYYGFTGDIISGNYLLNTYDRRNHTLEALTRHVFSTKYEYCTDPQDLCRTLFGIHLDDMLARFQVTFEPYRALGVEDTTLMQRLSNLNFRRIGYFARGAWMATTPVSLLQDQAVAQVYLELAEILIPNQDAHCRLGYIASPRLAWLPANQWCIPLWLEPRLYHPVRTYGVVVRDKLKAARKLILRPESRLGPAEAVYAALIAQCQDVGLFTPGDLLALLSREQGGPGEEALLLRLDTLVKTIGFAQGKALPEELATRLFPPLKQRDMLTLEGIASLSAS